MRCLVPLLILALGARSLAAQNPPAGQTDTAPQRTVEFTGLVLVNGFFTNSAVNNSDVPQLAEASSGVSGTGGTIRQTRLGVLVNDPAVLGGSFTGEVDADFFGGQQPSSGGRTFPLLRLRRALGTLQWSHVGLLFGQESPLVAGRSPRSLASVGFPDFAGAGNLWLWLPQVRFTLETGYTLRIALQAAALAPASGAPQATLFTTQLDSAERTKRPSLEGRLRLGWGPTDDPSEIAVGAHLGWLKGFDVAANDSLLASQAVTVDARIKIGFIELLGEAYTGQALASLGGGGIGQNEGLGGVPIRTKGGWGQLNLRPAPHVMFGGGCGLDDPDDTDVPASGRFRNFVCEGHAEWRPPGPLVFGFEFRRFSTRYQAGTVPADFTANHLNLAAGYSF